MYDKYTMKFRTDKFLCVGFEKGIPLSGLRRVQREPRVPKELKVPCEQDNLGAMTD